MEEKLEEKDRHVLDLQKKSKVTFFSILNALVMFKLVWCFILRFLSLLLFRLILHRKLFAKNLLMKAEIGRCVDKCKEEFLIPSGAVDQGIHSGYQFTYCKRLCWDTP